MECDSIHQSSSSTLGWGDLYNFGGVLTADMSTVMETIQPFFSPLLDSNTSTGYLEDALIEWSSLSKRRRLTFEENDHSENITFENLNCLSEIVNTSRVADFQQSLKLPEETLSASETINSSSSSEMDFFQNSHETPTAGTAGEPLSCSDTAVEDRRRARRKKMANGVVYPFAVVKPGGFEGDMTLNDINERIHMPPTRPVKHPVGDFACRPCISPDGPGISGKVVVSFTKIQTQGRGTITIVRTRG